MPSARSLEASVLAQSAVVRVAAVLLVLLGLWLAVGWAVAIP